MAVERNNTIQEKIANNIGFIAILVIVGIYIGWGLTKLVPNGKTVDEILSEAALSLTLGILIKNILKQQGIILGEQSSSFLDTVNMYSTTITKSVGIFNILPDFVEYKNKNAYKVVRSTILERSGLAYSDYFDNMGKYIGGDIVEPKRRFFRTSYKDMSREDIAIYKCLTLTLTMLTADELTSDVENNVIDPNAMGQTKKDWFQKGTLKQLIMAIFVALIFGYYGLTYAQNFDMGELIWKLIQVGSFMIMGFWQLLQGYQFIKGPYRNRMIKKANLLDEANEWNNANKATILQDKANVANV